MSVTTTQPATVEAVVDVWSDVLTLHHGLRAATLVGEGLLPEDHSSMRLLRSLDQAVTDVLDADGRANRPSSAGVIA